MKIFKKDKRREIKNKEAIEISNTTDNTKSSVKLRVFRINAIQDPKDVHHFDEFQIPVKNGQRIICIIGCQKLS